MLHVILYEPEIPENTGNIARMCIGLNATLHLIRPYGFILNDKRVRRSGVDYWLHLKLVEHDSYNDFINSVNKKHQLYYVTRYGIATPDKLKLKTKEDIYFMFGKESLGIPKDILLKHKNSTIRIPSSNKVRSLNLSNCVAIVGYEYVRQNGYMGLEAKESHKPIF